MLKKAFLAAVLAMAFLPALRADDGPWLTDFAKAQAASKAENRPILLDFTGSDWCAPCQLFEKQVLSKPEFLAYAKDHLVLMRLDYPQEKPQAAEERKQNEALANRFGIQGFPSFILLSPSGKKLYEQFGFSMYERIDPKAFVDTLDKAAKKG